MFNLLLVEDQPLTLVALTMLLGKYFPDANIEAAPCENQARDILRRYQKYGLQFDVAVLDLMLPAERGGNPEPSTLCADIRPLQPGAFVVHITAYRKGQAAQIHYEQYHPVDRPGITIEKTESNWEDLLLRKLASFRVERQLDQFSPPQPGGGALACPVGGGSRTATMAQLTNDIRTYWKLLDTGLKDRIKGNFDIDEQREPVGVAWGGRHVPAGD